MSIKYGVTFLQLKWLLPKRLKSIAKHVQKKKIRIVLDSKIVTKILKTTPKFLKNFNRIAIRLDSTSVYRVKENEFFIL